MKRRVSRSFLSTAVLCAAAGMPVSAQVFSGNTNDLPAAGRHSISLSGGAVVHSTDHAVLNRQSISLPGGGEIVTWSEVRDGREVPLFAVSFDGRRVAGRVMENDLTIGLRYASFDPLRGEPVVERSLQAPAQSAIRMVQFRATALPEMQEAIAAAGGEILRHLGNNTVIVRMAPGSADRVRALPFVRWVGAFHTAYKLDEAVLAGLQAGGDAEELRYSIECFERGMEAQQKIANRVVAMGGVVEVFTPDQFRMEATLTRQQLLEIAKMDEVHFIDPWGGPGGTDTNLVRDLGGATYLQTAAGAGFTGTGVRGEVFDTETRSTHTEFTTITPIAHSPTFGNAGNPHGTSCYSINFARGASANARGLLPNAAEGYFYDYSASTQFGGGQSRLNANQQLVNPALAFQCVFQTSSVGSSQVTSYTTISQEVDDYLFQTQLLSTQSQSNLGNQNSRPQAWAKNIVSGGAISHFNNSNRSAHQWASTAASCGSFGSASIGPAADGRVKPDLAFFYDCTFSAANGSNTAYNEFGGTSGATPSIAGHFGLFFQMWHEGVWAGHGGGSSVFASRAKMTTAKAALINTAYRYTWTAGGPNASITRNVQGWGMPNLQTLFDLRNKTFIVDEDDVITPLSTKSYQISVAPGEPALNVTMAYVDRPGTTSATTHRINDLSLKVTSPTGTVYWGNNGLTAGNFNTTGGSANTKDTVENVFVANPAAGVWTVEVSGDAIVQDTHVETPALDADFSLWLTGGVEFDGPTGGGPYAYSVRSNGDDHLYRIDLGTGVAVSLGQLTFGDAEGTCVGPDGNTYAIGGSVHEFWRVDMPPGTLVGPTGTRLGTDAGLEFHNGVLYNLQGIGGAAHLYTVNPATGSTSLVGSAASFADSLAINSLGQAFAVDAIFDDALKSVNLSTGALTTVGPLNVGNISEQSGAAFAPNHTLYALTGAGKIYTVNTGTGAATFVADVTVGGAAATGWESLAMDRVPTCVAAPLPPFNNTFVSTNTRGLWFVSPANTEICGLRVPDEAGINVQNVEVVRFSATPPSFPATTNNFVSLGRFVNVAGNDIIPVSIPVSAGDIIGVLGATGTTSQNNSYSAQTTFNSEIRGMTVEMRRLGMQANLNTTPAQNLWTENTSISRVEIYYKDGRNRVVLDADSAVTGANLGTSTLATPYGPVSFTGEIFAGTGNDPEFIAAGALGTVFDIDNGTRTAELTFGFDVDSVTFIYGGNLGEITVTALNAANQVVDQFFQADTGVAPAGPRTLAGSGIRKLRWADPTGSFAPLDNIVIHASGGACYANCDGSTTTPILNVADFSCFLTKFAASDPYANCDGSTTPPVLNVADFSCFLTKFAAGCP